ncbi:carbohydrate ABC transporter membrane protein 1 (CUT1 family) [Glaciihabitans tibetensis]|uniref:Carbohydrate ABC transporter membrane protein 1 (CUT1 family) n=1 Tax=Glaciihabitans tibetensis TaxID=1266600 RepID=A0A2T0VA74_9MICO|nr:sugar ABC transporter permease [Glaciihabitans tibetensis]PRY67054.1 carbohydrate ABC transporter membrane protein 1 (CUT1 family) [Glaciihabitans tibetensis]
MSTKASADALPTRRASRPAGRRGQPVKPTARQQGAATPWLFLAPYLLLFGGFVVLPAVLGVWISLHSWDYTLPLKPFVGLENYVSLFRPDSTVSGPFWGSMRATGIFTLFSVPLLLTIPLAVALLMSRKFPGRNFLRAIYFAPYVLGVAVVAVLWRYLLDNNIGLVNHYLGLLGLPDDTAWTTSTPAAWVALVGVTVWWTLGFNAVIYLAALQDIPIELYEAARVDGANAWQQFVHVTIPGLKPILSFITIITLLASANMFGQSYLMTQGGPGRETRTAIYQIAETGLRNFQMGSAAAMSYVLTLFLMAVSAFVFWIFREKKESTAKEARS